MFFIHLLPFLFFLLRCSQLFRMLISLVIPLCFFSSYSKQIHWGRRHVKLHGSWQTHFYTGKLFFTKELKCSPIVFSKIKVSSKAKKWKFFLNKRRHKNCEYIKSKKCKCTSSFFHRVLRSMIKKMQEFKNNQKRHQFFWMNDKSFNAKKTKWIESK